MAEIKSDLSEKEIVYLSFLIQEDHLALKEIWRSNMQIDSETYNWATRELEDYLPDLTQGEVDAAIKTVKKINNEANATHVNEYLLEYDIQSSTYREYA